MVEMETAAKTLVTETSGNLIYNAEEAMASQTLQRVADTAANTVVVPVVLMDNVKNNYDTVMEKGSKAQQIAAEKMHDNINNTAAVFVNPGAINSTMATAALDINEICSTGEKIVEVKNDLNSFWKAPEAGLFADTLDSVLGVLDEYLQSNDNIAENAKNISTLYTQEQALQRLAANSVGKTIEGSHQSNLGLTTPTLESK